MVTTKPSTSMASPSPSAATPSKCRRQGSAADENSDPNLPFSPAAKKSPAPPSSRKKNLSAGRAPAVTAIPAVPAPSPARRARRIVAVKKRGGSIDFDKCREALRSSQEEFFKKVCASETSEGEISRRDAVEDERRSSSPSNGVPRDVEGEHYPRKFVANAKFCLFSPISEASETECESSMRKSVPEPGSGRVKNLVEAFENLLTIGGETDKQNGRDEEKPMPLMAEFARSSAEFLQGEKGAQRSERLCSSYDGNAGERFSCESTVSEGGGRQSKRNSTEIMRSSWNKKSRTSLHPFNLLTEQRGAVKKELFCKKLHEMAMEEERQRIPIAQGLPWTTDEPQCLLKPPVKERTEPAEIVLHTDVRAIERAEFDGYIAERIKFAEQLRAERERQQKLEEDEALRRLRKELVPKAHPMPYFDRPFIPKRSTRPRTVPKEPRFHKLPVRTSCYLRLRSSRDEKLEEHNRMSSSCCCSVLK